MQLTYRSNRYNASNQSVQTIESHDEGRVLGRAFECKVT